MKENSKTDWVRIRSMKDDEIDTSDIPELDVSLFENAELGMPARKEPITLHLDKDLVEWYKPMGRGYQTRMNAVLRMYMNAHNK